MKTKRTTKRTRTPKPAPFKPLDLDPTLSDLHGGICALSVIALAMCAEPDKQQEGKALFFIWQGMIRQHDELRAMLGAICEHDRLAKKGGAI